MKSLLFVLSFLFCITAFAEKQNFGEPISLKNPISINKAIKLSNNENSTKELLVEATVEKVCKKKGCWMGLKSKKGDVRVTFKNYGFFVPFRLEGKTVLVQGKVEIKKMNLKETKHFAEDEGEDPSKITKPQLEYRMIATGVKVKS